MENYNIIPLESGAGYNFLIGLEEIQYTFTVHWNVTASAYFLDIYSATNSVDIKGIKLVPGIDLLAPYPINDLGSMYLIDYSGNDSEATFDSLGSTHQLLYTPTDATI